MLPGCLRVTNKRRGFLDLLCLFVVSSFLVTSPVGSKGKSLTIDVKNGIPKNDAYAPSLGGGQTITVEFSGEAPADGTVTVQPADLENGPFPVGEYRLCNLEGRTTWPALFPLASPQFEFINWQRNGVSTLIIHTPPAQVLSDDKETAYCFQLLDSKTNQKILVVATAGVPRSLLEGSWFTSVVCPAIATAVALLAVSS